MGKPPINAPSLWQSIAPLGISTLALASLIPVYFLSPHRATYEDAVPFESISREEAQAVEKRIDKATHYGWDGGLSIREKTVAEWFDPLREKPLPDGRRFGGWSVLDRVGGSYRIEAVWIPGPKEPYYYVPASSALWSYPGAQVVPLDRLDHYKADWVLVAFAGFMLWILFQLVALAFWFSFLRISTRAPMRGALVHYRGRAMSAWTVAR